MSWSGRHPWDANDPYPDDSLPKDECDHEHYDSDILTGRAWCHVCGHRWEQTVADIERERQAQIAYDQQCAEWEHEMCPPMAKPVSGIDDDLPF